MNWYGWDRDKTTGTYRTTVLGFAVEVRKCDAHDRQYFGERGARWCFAVTQHPGETLLPEDWGATLSETRTRALAFVLGQVARTVAEVLSVHPEANKYTSRITFHLNTPEGLVPLDKGFV